MKYIVVDLSQICSFKIKLSNYSTVKKDTIMSFALKQVFRFLRNSENGARAYGWDDGGWENGTADEEDSKGGEVAYKTKTKDKQT